MIQRLSLEDLDWLVELDCLCFEKPWSYLALQEELVHPDARCLGVPNRAAVLSRQQGEECWIFRIMTAPSARRQGFAKALIEALGNSETWLEVSELNLGAIAFYESLGFEKIVKRPNYYPEDAWVMRRLKCSTTS